MTTISRRTLLGASGATLATPALAAWPEAGHGMPVEGPETPHICLGPIADSEINPSGIRRYTQIGLTHIIVNGSGYPWDAEMLKAKVKTLAENGLVAGDIGLPWTGTSGSGMREIIYARPGRDKAIEDVKKSIRAASSAGVPIVEYNFYAHRLEEGYFDEPDPSRGNAGVESFYYDRVKDLPPLSEEGRIRWTKSGATANTSSKPLCRWRKRTMSAWRFIRTIRLRPSRAAASRSCPRWMAGKSWWG